MIRENLGKFSKFEILPYLEQLSSSPILMKDDHEENLLLQASGLSHPTLAEEIPASFFMYFGLTARTSHELFHPYP